MSESQFQKINAELTTLKEEAAALRNAESVDKVRSLLSCGLLSVFLGPTRATFVVDVVDYSLCSPVSPVSPVVSLQLAHRIMYLHFFFSSSSISPTSASDRSTHAGSQ